MAEFKIPQTWNLLKYQWGIMLFDSYWFVPFL